MGKDAAFEKNAQFALDVGDELCGGIVFAKGKPGGQRFLHQAVQDGALGRAAARGTGCGNP